MATTWFQVLYSTKKSFDGMDQFNKTVEYADKLTSMEATRTNDDGRIRILKEFLAEFGMMDDKHSKLMLDSMNSEHLALVEESVKKFYEELDKVNLSEDQKEAYNEVLVQIIFSKGTYLNKNKRRYRDDITRLSEDVMDKLFESFNALKSGEKSLQNMVKFIYENKLTGIIYKNITGNDNESTVSDDVLCAPFIINALADRKQFAEDDKQKFYNAFVDDYKSDKEFIDKLKPLNRDYVNIADVEDSLNKILGVYKDVKIVDYSYIRNSVNSPTRIKADAKGLVARFSGKFTTPSLVLAIEHVENYMNGTPSANSIINDGNKDDVFKEIDAFIVLLFNNYSEHLKKIVENINEYNRILSTEFHSQTKTITIKDGIKLWNDFHVSGMYKYYGKYIDESIEDEVAGILADDEYSLRYNGKDVKVIKKDINVLELMSKIDMNSISHNYESYFDFISGTFAKSDLSVAVQIQVELTVLNFIKAFLSLDYKSYPSFDPETMIKGSFGFDAVCNLVYSRDKFIKESVVTEMLMFAGYVINESDDNVEYFNKLADRIKAKTGEPNEKSLVTYVAKYADFEDGDNDETENKEPENKPDDASQINILSDEQINTEIEAAKSVKDAPLKYK